MRLLTKPCLRLFIGGLGLSWGIGKSLADPVLITAQQTSSGASLWNYSFTLINLQLPAGDGVSEVLFNFGSGANPVALSPLPSGWFSSQDAVSIDFYSGVPGFSPTGTDLAPGQALDTLNVQAGIPLTAISFTAQLFDETTFTSTPFQGTAIVSSGTLTVSNTVTLSSPSTASTLMITPTGVLQVSTGGALGSGPVSNAGVLTFNGTGTTVASNLSGAGTVNQLAGVTIFTGANTMSGPVNVLGGTLQLGSATSAGLLAAASVLNSSVLALDPTAQLAVTAAITGGGTVTHIGTGTTTITGAASYTGLTSIPAGKVVFSGGVSHSIGAVSGTGTLLVDANTTLTSDGVNLLNGTWTINGTQIIRSSGTAGAYAMHYYGQDSTVLSGISVTSNLTFGAGTKLDLQNNALIVEATSANKVSLLAQIATDVTQGYITSSTVATNSAYTLVVAADNSNINASRFGGIQLDANSIIVTEALKGDANLDGYVDLSDFNIWLSNLGISSSAYSTSTGDLNNDGFVDLNDFNQWLSNLGRYVGANPAPSFASGGTLADSGGLSTGGAAATPEPASLALLSLGVLGMTCRRRSSRRS